MKQLPSMFSFILLFQMFNFMTRIVTVPREFHLYEHKTMVGIMENKGFGTK